MSHNKIKIGTASPDVSGDIDIQISDLSDCTITTPQSGQALEYNGAAWVNANVSGNAAFILFGQGETSNYSNSPATALGAGDTLYAYDTGPINTIASATLSTTNDWLNSVTLPAGEYLLCAGTGIEFSASGYMQFHFHDTSVAVSQTGSIGDSVNSFANGAGFVQSYLKLTTQTTINLEISAQSNVDSIANQGATISESLQILIIQIG